MPKTWKPLKDGPKSPTLLLRMSSGTRGSVGSYRVFIYQESRHPHEKKSHSRREEGGGHSMSRTAIDKTRREIAFRFHFSHEPPTSALVIVDMQNYLALKDFGVAAIMEMIRPGSTT